MKIQNTMIVIFLVMFSTVSIAEKKIMTFSTHVRKDTIVYKTTFLILEESLKRIGYELALKTFPGKRALHMANTGQTDGEAHRIYDITNNGKYPNLVRVEEIQQVINMYAYATQTINLDNGWEDLASYKVAVLSGNVFATEMSNKYAKSTDELPDTMTMFRFLELGRADIALYTPSGAHLVLAMDEFKNTKIKEVEPVLSSISIYAYLHKKHSELAPKLSKALREMKSDGTYQRLVENVYK